MSIPTSFREDLVFVASHPIDRIAFYERVAATTMADNTHLVAIVGAEALECLRSMIRLGGVDPRRATLISVDEAIGAAEPAWQGLCDSADRLVQAVHERLGNPALTLAVDLDAAFAHCHAASEMMSLVYHLRHQHGARGTRVASVVSASSLPKSLPEDFFDLYPVWAFAENRGCDGAAAMDAAAERLALASPEFRQRFLALASGDPARALDLVPDLVDDLRCGFILLDLRFTIRFCSPRAAKLLGRPGEDLVGHPITTCVDGVDLVTVKHECEKLGPGRPARSPFIASWRMSPGEYEPRQVTVDPVSSGHHVVGYLLSLAHAEQVRGPRAVYQQLKEEMAGLRTSDASVEDEQMLTEDEAVSGDLHGTQITRREHEIILLILRDMTNRQIADHLNIAEVTVKKHLTSVYRKLRITNRRELVVSFARPGGAS